MLEVDCDLTPAGTATLIVDLAGLELRAGSGACAPSSSISGQQKLKDKNNKNI